MSQANKTVFDLSETEFEHKFNNEILPHLRRIIPEDQINLLQPSHSKAAWICLFAGFVFGPLFFVALFLFVKESLRNSKRKRIFFTIKNYVFNYFGIKFHNYEKEDVSFNIRKCREVNRFLNNGDQFRVDDILSFDYKGMPIEIVEAFFYDKDNSINIKLLLSTKLNKNFKGITTIYSRGPFARYNEEIHFEDGEFNQLFKTFSSDQVEARYLITPAFIERIKKYKKETCNHISILFNNQLGFQDNIFFSISSYHDSFEIPNTALLYYKYYFWVLQEIKDLLNIVDTLKLDQDIGM